MGQRHWRKLISHRLQLGNSHLFPGFLSWTVIAGLPYPGPVLTRAIKGDPGHSILLFLELERFSYCSMTKPGTDHPIVYLSALPSCQGRIRLSGELGRNAHALHLGNSGLKMEIWSQEKFPFPLKGPAFFLLQLLHLLLFPLSLSYRLFLKIVRDGC